jgi:Cu(I)/Ag(I) efflux system membrane protein CusA/SilA
MLTIPIAALLSFIPMRMLGVSSNIMSLGGIAIAIGAMVDAAIVVVEQTHKRLEQWERNGRSEDFHTVVVGAIKEVASPSFFALLVIGVSFLPVLALEAQEGRLFRPLALTKTLAMIVAAVLAITLDPALRLLFTHARNFSFRPVWMCRTANAVLIGRIHSEERHPISRFLIRVYEPVCLWSLRRKWVVIGGAAALVILTVPAYLSLGSEFMPPLDEQALFYMPSTLPGISVRAAQELLQTQDRLILQFPEVARVFGKAGRAETATDPAPLSMMETVITLKPREQWRKRSTWYSAWAPEWWKPVLRHIAPDWISTEQLVSEMNDALRLPGVSNAWTMPIRARIDMLSTNMRTPVGIKVSGADVHAIEDIGSKLEALLPQVRGTRSVFAERTGGGYFLDVDWDRQQLARNGLSIADVQTIVSSGVGGETVTTTVEGQERYSVNVRYMRDARSDIAALSAIPVAAQGATVVPVAELARVGLSSGPSMLRNENGLLTGYVYVDVGGRDVGGYVEEARKLVREKIQLPTGYALQWSGQFEAMERVAARLKVVVPFTLALIFLLLYMNTRSVAKTLIVLLAVPFSAVGAIWLLWFLGYNMSVGVWVGLIALLGVDAETGVFMLLYLDLAYAQARREGRLSNLGELREAIRQGAVKRIRPKFMTVAIMLIALGPILWSTGIGSDVMKRIAAPMVGGILTSFVLELVIYPAIYEAWKWNAEVKGRVA